MSLVKDVIQKEIVRQGLIELSKELISQRMAWRGNPNYQDSDPEQIRIELGCDMGIQSFESQAKLIDLIDNFIFFPRHGLIYAGSYQETSELFFKLLDQEKAFQLESTNQYNLQLVINALHNPNQVRFSMHLNDLLPGFIAHLKENGFSQLQLTEFINHQKEILITESEFYGQSKYEEERMTYRSIIRALKFLKKYSQEND